MSHKLLAAAIVVAAFASAARADDPLTIDQFKALLEKPHSEKLTVDELKFLTAGRKFDAKVKTTNAEGETTESEVIRVDEKWVDGAFVISTVNLPNAQLHIGVSYDAKLKIFRKYVLLPGDIFLSSIGIRDGDSRSLSFSGKATINGVEYHSIGQETHGDKKTTWTEATFADGKLVTRQVGEATKVE